MNAELYLSTGAFIGRINGRDHRLLFQCVDQLDCDGFEVMLYENWYDQIDVIAREIRASGARCPALHADKSIGSLMGCPGDPVRKRRTELWKRNCDFAASIGAGKVVAHLWGPPYSDCYMEPLAEQYGELLAVAHFFGVELVAENCICGQRSPLRRIERLAALYPDAGFTMDTRQAQFHDELPDSIDSPLVREGRVRHVHLNDYAGGYKAWQSLYPIPWLGEGKVDFAAFFAGLERAGYAGSVTIETPAMIPDGVDVKRLAEGIAFVRRFL